MQTQPELHRKPSQTKSRISTRTVVTMAMLCAISLVVSYLCSFFPHVAGILKFDLKDTVIVIGGFLLGPVPAFLIAVVSSLIEMFTMGTTGPIGMVMNILSTSAFVCPAAYFYKKKHTMSGALTGLVISVVLLTGVMILWNYLITPIYMNVPRPVVVGMLIPVFLPFNLLKGGVNAVLTILLYKPVVTALRKAHLAPASHPANVAAPARRMGAGHVLVAAIVLVTLVVLTLVLMGVI